MLTTHAAARRRPVATRLLTVLPLLLLVVTTARQVDAASIVLGTRIDLTPTTFALPVQILDGVAVEGWQFDLTYDPLDVLVATECDALGDSHCSFLTGPVTEGDFFASGAPFNLLLPGFVVLDPLTLAQTGLLDDVFGAFGGAPPLPSGNGTIAFVAFTIVGTGTSTIDVEGSVNTPVPEPGTLALFTVGLALPVARRLIRRTRSGRASPESSPEPLPGE